MRKLTLIILFHSYITSGVAQVNVPAQLNLVKRAVADKHIEPRNIDDNFSADWFGTVLKSLDPAHLYFTATDLKALDKYRFALDEEIASSNAHFYSAFTTLYKERMVKTQNLVETICSRPFDLSANEFFSHRMDTVIAANEKELERKWYTLIKAEVLNYLGAIGANQYAVKKTINRQEIIAKEPEARAKVKTKYRNKIKAYTVAGRDFETALASLYINSFLRCMDPHSQYMDISARQKYQAGVNTEGYFFGFTLADTDKGEVAIALLEPGGPAWASGIIHKDDVLVEMKWAEKAAIDLTGLDAAEVSELMDESNTARLELTVRKKNGQLEKVTLQKRKLENDENIVKSFVLKGAKNIGYITLPSFYTRWEDEGGSKCANDVAKEIVKLKRDSITGLLLDLRYNGGGSMQEAIEMAGIFIDEGAICQFNEKGEKLVTLKDINRGVIYNGPLVILVNGYSASASELLAASLQDYNRALIVGSRTHGKGTSQQIYPLENNAATVVNSSGNAFVKLTGGKFYRVTGKSSQFYGVLPDIQIANPFDELGEYESKIPFALKPDTVESYKYFKSMKELPKNGLQEKSTLRVSGNSKFRSIQMQAQQIRQERGGKTLLTWEAVEKRIKEGYGFGLAKPESSTGYTVLNNNADEKFFATNELAKGINKSWRERVAADPYIEESFFILLDLINQNK